jgi:flagellar hook-associated protein 2
LAIEIPEIQTNNPQFARAYAKIAKAEQKPIERIDQKMSDLDGRLKLVQEFKGKMTGLRDAVNPFKSVADFRELVGQSSHPDILQASSIDKAFARPGSYEFEVVSLANSNSVMTKGFPDRDRSEVGVGWISFTTPEGEDRDVYINSSNNTLDGVASAINRAGLGVRAQVVNDGTDADSPWRLVINGEKSGWKNNFEWPEFNFLDGDFDLDLDRVREGNSAVIKFNGQPMMADENTIKNLLPGVNLNLKSAKPGQKVTLDIKPDIEKIEAKAKNFVDKMNEALSFIQRQNERGAEGVKDPARALRGDIGLLTIENRLRELIQKTENQMSGTDVQKLRDMGITFNRAGTLDFDSKKFQTKLESNFDDVASLFSGADGLGGFAGEVVSIVEGTTRSGNGTVTIREQSIRDQKNRLQREKDRVSERVQGKIERVRQQFGRAEAALQQLESTRAGLGNPSLLG